MEALNPYLAIAAVTCASGLAVFLAALLYVRALLAASRIRASFLRVALVLAIYAAFAAVLCAPLLLVFFVEALWIPVVPRWAPLVWVPVCWVAALSPTFWYVFRKRIEELRAHGFYRA